MEKDDFSLQVVGRVESPIKERKDAPKQGGEGAPDVWIEFGAEYAKALDGLAPGDDLVLLTWFDRARRDVLQVHPRGVKSNPLTGVFDTRSPNRPNPIGLHPVKLKERRGLRLLVGPLEALDGTPIIDVKPAIRGERPGWSEPWRLLLRAAEDAWARGLLSGVNGNLSLRERNKIWITGSGVVKARMRPEDLAEMELGSGEVISGANPSTEAAMHLEIYKHQPEAKAVVHIHPPYCLALDLLGGLTEPALYEAKAILGQMAAVEAIEPGTRELAEAVGKAAADKRAVFMRGHGLTAWGADATDALALAEEIESLAKIAWLARAGANK